MATFQPQDGQWPRSGPSAGGRAVQSPLHDIFSISSRPSSLSLREKQVVGPVSSASNFVPGSLQSSATFPARQSAAGHQKSGQASSNLVEVIDLTKDDIHLERSMNLYPRRVTEPAHTERQSLQPNVDSLNTFNDTSNLFAETNSRALMKYPGLSNRMECLPGIGENRTQAGETTNGDVDNSLSPAMPGSRSVSRSQDSSDMSPRPRRTIPWSSHGTGPLESRQGTGFSSRTTDLHRSGSAQEKSWGEGVSRNSTPRRRHLNSAKEFIGSPKFHREGYRIGQQSPIPTGPRLKLNPPKPPSSQQQGLISSVYSSSGIKPGRSPRTGKSVISISNDKGGLGQGRTPRSLSTETQQTHFNESDSDDATAKLLRSINQASAMYDKEPQESPGPRMTVRAEESHHEYPHESQPEYTSPHSPLKPISYLGSPELGERFNETDDVEQVSESRSEIDRDAATSAPQSERLPAADDFVGSPELQHSPSPGRMLATKELLMEVVVEECQQSTSNPESLACGEDGSNERGDLTPDLKLLEAIFKPLVEEMRVGQEYLVAGYLTRARKGAIEFPGPKIDKSLPDPFAAANTIPAKQSSSFNPLRRVKMESKVVNARNKAPLNESQAVAFQSYTQRLPKYNSIVRLGLNVLAPNDKDLRYLPYFPSEEEKDGADAADHKRREELLEGFDNRIKFLPQERKCAEQADFWREHAEYFLEEVGCTCVDVMFYLLHDEDAEWRPECQISEEALSQWQNREMCCSACETKFEGDHWDRLSETLETHKPDEKTLALAGLVCSVFSKFAKFSIWHIVSTDADVLSLLEETERSWRGEKEPRRPKSQSLCMLCHVFDCPTHGAYLEDDLPSRSSSEGGRGSRKTDQDSSSDSSEEVETKQNIRQTVALPERPRPDGQQHMCGFFCVDPGIQDVDILGLHQNGEAKGAYNTNKIKEIGDPGFADEDTCSESCFWDLSNRSGRSINDLVRSDRDERFADWTEKDIRLYRAMLAACTKIKRGPCIMAITVARPCTVIFREILFDLHTTPHPVPINGTENPQPPPTNGYKDKNYWFESSQTYDHHKRRPFVPCSHHGPCHKNPDCTCWTGKIACEWICGCDRACSRRFQGCRCVARGAKVCFKDSNCDCWILNRECDPWLCGKCGVLEVLDPVNRHDDSILKGRCKNAMIQRNVPRRTLKGPSEVHGWGLFAGTDIRANEFIGEYKGEVISEEESNRRGLVYHYRGIEYLFRLNKEQEIDSSRAGNKMRFINNSERPSTINVYPQPMLCNGVQRIGLFAKRNLLAGEEMFFRYGYPESVTKHFWEKEDLQARRALNNDNVLDGNEASKAERIKGKGVKGAVLATKQKAKKGISRQIKRVLQRPGGKERHAHFLDDIADDDEPEASSSQPLSHQLHRTKKRKRNSSPVIDESTFDLPGAESKDAREEEESAPGPSGSSIGARTEVAESDTDDEEYEEDDEEDDASDDDEDNDNSVSSDMEADILDEDLMVNQTTRRPRTSTSASASASQSLLSSRQSSSSNKRSLQTAAARRVSLENRKRAKERKGMSDAGGMGTEMDHGPSGAALAATSSSAAEYARPVGSTISSPRSGRGGKKSSSSKDSDPVIPPGRSSGRGRKRGRPFGWKKGVHFK